MLERTTSYTSRMIARQWVMRVALRVHDNGHHGAARFIHAALMRDSMRPVWDALGQIQDEEADCRLHDLNRERIYRQDFEFQLARARRLREVVHSELVAALEHIERKEAAANCPISDRYASRRAMLKYVDEIMSGKAEYGDYEDDSDDADESCEAA